MSCGESCLRYNVLSTAFGSNYWYGIHIYEVLVELYSEAAARLICMKVRLKRRCIEWIEYILYTDV